MLSKSIEDNKTTRRFIDNSFYEENPEKNKTTFIETSFSKNRNILNKKPHDSENHIKDHNKIYVKKDKFYTCSPGPSKFIYFLHKAYDIRRSLDPNKGFTFGRRIPLKEMKLSSLAPNDSVVIRSDIDEISQKPKFP